MPLPRLIPCLDVAAGRVVKGVRFQGLRDVGDPVERGALYSEEGADELVFLDVTATLEGRPILGICHGLQLALDETEEDGGVAGLGLVEGRAVQLRDGRVPRIGWARVDDCEAFYFAHSYAAETPHAVSWSEGVVAEVRDGSFVGCQFHPEKSGAAGAAYLESLCLSLV